MNPVRQGVDVGGTTIKGLLVDADDTVLEQWTEQTPRDDRTGEQTIATIVSRIEASRWRTGIEAIGIVVPGLVDEDKGICRQSVNLGWKDVAVAGPLGDALRLPIAFGHDVRAGALAEARTGASARTPGVAAFLPIGTGLAAAYTHNGEVLTFGGLAGEVGQIRLLQGPHAGSTIEDIASAGAIARRLGVPNARRATDLVRAGDPAAVAVWNDALVILADVIAWITVTVGPELVVIGGGLSASADLLLPALTQGLAARVADAPLPTIVKAAHGVSAGAVGAAQLAADVLRKGARQ
ncbi:ROK family protein [Subtercola lobariae]|uniref:Glucokinase n=1 Tax=Subtercola lobariae TaxID=1588641 RepID=A0A917B0R0_9MICO|nr:ROK family protein [Subtercola lobariae]GGF10441.1 glucokinase [Subtercola lobariae]